IVLPADWRVAPALRGVTPPSGELDRVEFTSQSSDEWTHVVGLDVVVPWDLVIEVHDRRGVLPMDWSRLDGCGPNPCVVGETTLNQSPAYAASWPISSSQRMHAYYVVRGDGRSLDEVHGPGRSGHVQVPDLELGLREVVHHSADAHVLGARCEVAERIEPNYGIGVLLVGDSCRRHAERLLAVVELQDLPAEGHARLGTKLIELVEVPFPHKGDGHARLARAAGAADAVGK